MTATVKIEKTDYAGWPNCYRLSNGEAELVVTTDVGPRIIRYAGTDGPNMFLEYPEQLGKAGEKTWQARGGHRLWAAPEIIPDTYAIDNSPVAATVNGSTLTVLQPVEPETGLQKQMTIELAPSGSQVRVLHRVTNTWDTPRRLAPWALTQLAPGGTAIVAIPPRGSHEEFLLPTNPLTMWAYTDFSDSRWTFTSRYILLRNDPNNKQPQKTGLWNAETVAGYLNHGFLFVKRAHAPGTPDGYPDFGCSFEAFTNHEFLELETLGPLITLPKDQFIEHEEQWSLSRNVTLDKIGDAEIDRLFQLAK